VAPEAGVRVESSLTGGKTMSMTKRSAEYEAMMREQEECRDPHEELAYQVWADDGGPHRDEPEDAGQREF
jgi:hypothetical protein